MSGNESMLSCMLYCVICVYARCVCLRWCLVCGTHQAVFCCGALCLNVWVCIWRLISWLFVRNVSVISKETLFRAVPSPMEITLGNSLPLFVTLLWLSVHWFA